MKKGLVFLLMAAMFFVPACSENNQNKEKNFYLENSTIMSINEAYDEGYLNKNDLMHISYFLNGMVYKIPFNEDDINDLSKWIQVDFVPQTVEPTINSNVEYDIKSSYYYNYLQDFQDENGSLKYSKEIIEIDYLGCYNNCYIARINSKIWNFGDKTYTIRLDDIVWQQSSPLVKVFIFNK